jgi:hypothetical protein
MIGAHRLHEAASPRQAPARVKLKSRELSRSGINILQNTLSSLALALCCAIFQRHALFTPLPQYSASAQRLGLLAAGDWNT